MYQRDKDKAMQAIDNIRDNISTLIFSLPSACYDKLARLIEAKEDISRYVNTLSTTPKDIDYYMSLPYTYELTPDPEGGWFIRVKELPGCMSQGDTVEEALDMIRDAMEGLFEVELEDGADIPEPEGD